MDDFQTFLRAEKDMYYLKKFNPYFVLKILIQ